MRELSEKELELEYKNLKLTDIPDMWENIERNLAPKNPVKAQYFEIFSLLLSTKICRIKMLLKNKSKLKQKPILSRPFAVFKKL